MKNHWLRYGLASLTLIGGGSGILLAACSDDEGPASAVDAGFDQSTPPPTDSGGGDTGTDAGDTRPNAKIQLVNAATDFGPSNPVGAVRFCYGLGPTAISPLPPLPDRKSNPLQPYPGVYIGTGGAAQGTGADLTTVPLTPYLLNAGSLAARGLLKPDAGGPGVSCADILGAADAGGAMVEGVDYWKLPEIPAGTFAKDKSVILVLTGCAGDSALTTAKCGADFVAGGPGNGNLKVSVFEVDRATAIASDKIGAQFIHASPAGAAFLATVPADVVPGFITGTDATTFKGISGADGGVPVPLNAKTDLAQVSGVNVASDSFTANPNIATLGIPLQSVQLLSYGGNVPDGGAYRNGAAFTFIALGDPAESPDAGGTFNFRTFHYIALPNDPVSETYKP